jgi:hypothetical protein
MGEGSGLNRDRRQPQSGRALSKQDEDGIRLLAGFRVENDAHSLSSSYGVIAR